MTKQKKTIQDFGDQFSRFQNGHNDGFYGQLDGFQDFFGPLLVPGVLKGAKIGEIGSGTGRVVNILLDDCKAAEVTALEPSSAFNILKKNTANNADKIIYVNEDAKSLPLAGYDYLFAVGVLHHIPDVDPVVRRAYEALIPGGKFFAWVYGREGNHLYLTLFEPLRLLTQRLPDFVVVAMSFVLNVALSVYIHLCRILPLPMRAHMVNASSRYNWKQRMFVIFDQLNPAYAKYYTGPQVRKLFEKAGFKDVKTHHRHAHSWAVSGVKTG